MGGEFQLLFIGPELLLLHPERNGAGSSIHVRQEACYIVYCIVYPNNLIQFFIGMITSEKNLVTWRDQELNTTMHIFIFWL